MLQPPWSTSHCSSRMCPVAAASCAGVALFEARASAARPSSLTRNCRHSRRPHLAAWCTGPAPWASVMAGERWPEDASFFRVARSPARAAWMARWSTIPGPYEYVMAHRASSAELLFFSSHTRTKTHALIASSWARKATPEQPPAGQHGRWGERRGGSEPVR